MKALTILLANLYLLPLACLHDPSKTFFVQCARSPSPSSPSLPPPSPPLTPPPKRTSVSRTAQLHDPSRPFVCDSCPCRFETSAIRSNHIASHCRARKAILPSHTSGSSDEHAVKNGGAATVASAHASAAGKEATKATTPSHTDKRLANKVDAAAATSLHAPAAGKVTKKSTPSTHTSGSSDKQTVNEAGAGTVTSSHTSATRKAFACDKCVFSSDRASQLQRHAKVRALFQLGCVDGFGSDDVVAICCADTCAHL